MRIETTAPTPQWYIDLCKEYGTTGECPQDKKTYYISVVIPYQTVNVKIYRDDDEIYYDGKYFRDKKTDKILKDSWGWYAVKDKNGNIIYEP